MGNCGSSDPNVNLHELCRKGNVNGVRRLLKDLTVDINGRDHRSEPFNTPLIDATVTENLEVVRLLLQDTRLDPNIRNEEGDSALHVAIRDGKHVLSFEIGDILVKDPRTTIHCRNTHDKKPFQYINDSKNKAAFEKLIKELNLNPDETPTPAEDRQKIELSLNPPTVVAAKKQIAEAEDANDSPSLHDICKANDIQALRKVLEDERLDLNGHDHRNYPFNTPLIDAVQSQNIEIVRILLTENRLDPNYRNENGETALHVAVKGKMLLDYEIAALLMNDERTSVHVRDKKDKKPFDYVEGGKNEERFLQLFTEKNIDIEAPTPTEDKDKIMKSHHLPAPEIKKQHKTADDAKDSYDLHELCKTGNVDKVRALLENEHIDVNGRDHRSEPFNTPFLDAAANHSLEVVRLMLEHDRVDVNARNEEGQTALHFAIQGKLQLDLEAAEILLKCPRVNRHVRDKHDKKAFEYLAASANKKKLEAFLAENSIDVNEATPKQE